MAAGCRCPGFPIPVALQLVLPAGAKNNQANFRKGAWGTRTKGSVQRQQKYKERHSMPFSALLGAEAACVLRSTHTPWWRNPLWAAL